MTNNAQLLPLPEPALQSGYNAYTEQRFFHSSGMADSLGYKHSQKIYYTAEQMHEYALACIEAAGDADEKGE